MAKTTSPLDEYFKNYVKNLNTGARVDSFATFVDKLLEDEEQQTPRRAVKARRINLSGAFGTGYADYLKDKLDEKQSTKGAGASRYAKDYQAYVERAKKERDSLYKSVRNEIISAKLLNGGEAYQYALSRGLNESEANAVKEESYRSLFAKYSEQLFNMAVKYELDAEDAEYLALEYGMKKSDAEKLKAKIKNLHSRTPNETGAIRYADKASAPTQTDLFLKGYIYEKLKRKQG